MKLKIFCLGVFQLEKLFIFQVKVYIVILLENILLIKTLTSKSNIRLQKFYRDINVNHYTKLHVRYVIYSRKSAKLRILNFIRA